MILADSARNLAGPLALLVLLLMGAASWFLFRSMTSRIKRLPRSFDDPDSDSRSDEDDGS